MFSEHLVESQVLVGVTLNVVGLLFLHTSLHTGGTVCTRVCISRLEVPCPAVVIDRGESQPVRYFDIKVEIAGELVCFLCGMVSIRKGIQVIQVRAVYPSAVTVGNQIAIFIVWAISREHGIFGGVIILGVVGILHRA